MQPLQYDLRSPAAKDNSITHAAVARSNLDAAITMRSAETELQNTIELRATVGRKLQLQNRISTPERKKDDFEALFNRILEGKSVAPKWRKSGDKSLSHLLSLKNAFRERLPPKLHRQLLHQHHLQSHLQ